MSKMDVEKFINLIYEHTYLWDQSDSSYNLRDLHRKAWREISEEMEISGKYNLLRYNYLSCLFMTNR